ncbi:DEKNAAC104411 [Brettanomyces naardenensis]|uniref:DEKNAAC104411 n=1 Tax=Brettanomyces naardenensis TaxID=13370 RepID=A0A448YQR1_BRENA|nr:DEKNAAC104411 [Brettanomyces naardenensis]
MELSNTSTLDSGLRKPSFYQSRMSPFRFQLRSLFLNLINKESPSLGYLQSYFRCKSLDYYFLYSANLGAHMFYVLMCPLPGWFGYTKLLRDSVAVLGLGIYLTGFVKDYLCLPRPRSPPLRRLTLSHYTAQECGCPSSHTANATSVCLLALHLLSNSWDDHSLLFNLSILITTSVYFLTLVLGRIYCGMHGYVDLAVGSIIGSAVFVIRMYLGDWWDEILLNDPSILVPLGLTAFYYLLVYLHPVALDPCPCFEDSVSFVGVLIGLDTIHWLLANYSTGIDGFKPEDVPFTYEGLPKMALRIAVGVASVSIWKSASKPVLMKVIGWKGEKERKGKSYGEKDRGDGEIIVRMIVYAGIPMMVVLGKYLFTMAGV